MNIAYSLTKTIDHLIKIADTAKYRTVHTKPEVMDEFQQAFLRCKGTYGVNAQISRQHLMAEIDRAEIPSTLFRDNYAGVNGLLQKSEQIVYDAFVNAIQNKSGEGFFLMMYVGYRALMLSTVSNMQLRTDFALQSFPLPYFELLAEQMWPEVERSVNNILLKNYKTELVTALATEMMLHLRMMAMKNVGAIKDSTQFSAQIKTHTRDTEEFFQRRVAHYLR